LAADLKAIDVTIADSLQAWPSGDRMVLESFPLMSPWRAAVLLSEIGDVRTFHSDRQLRKLLGWYPEIVESGTSVSKQRLGLKGRRIARRELWLWSIALLSPIMPPTPFAEYYKRLVGRGMAKPTAVGHLAGKLISVLFHCLKAEQAYDPVRHARQLGLKDVLVVSEVPTSCSDVTP
jgi:transposase